VVCEVLRFAQDDNALLNVSLVSADYGLPEAADIRSNGEGTNAGLRRTSRDPSAGTSSGPSAGGAGSTVLAATACCCIRSSSVPCLVTWVLAQLESSPTASKQDAILMIMFSIPLRGQKHGSANGLYNYYISRFEGKYHFLLRTLQLKKPSRSGGFQAAEFEAGALESAAP
jgi:hypothetical protein